MSNFQFLLHKPLGYIIALQMSTRCMHGIFMPRSLCGSVIVDQSYCGGCHSNRSHSRNEWEVQAAGRGSAPNWQPLWGRRSKQRRCGGGKVAMWKKRSSTKDLQVSSTRCFHTRRTFFQSEEWGCVHTNENAAFPASVLRLQRSLMQPGDDFCLRLVPKIEPSLAKPATFWGSTQLGWMQPCIFG